MDKKIDITISRPIVVHPIPALFAWITPYVFRTEQGTWQFKSNTLLRSIALPITQMPHPFFPQLYCVAKEKKYAFWFSAGVSRSYFSPITPPATYVPEGPILAFQEEPFAGRVADNRTIIGKIVVGHVSFWLKEPTPMHRILSHE